MNDSILQKHCTGCGACVAKCPVQAIEFKANEEGFLVPTIDQTRCTDCHLCERTCPVINQTALPNPEYYAVKASDADREHSTSGGVFTVLAKHILKRGGIIAGAAMMDDARVQHILIDSEEDLQKLQGSKYVQSDAHHVYAPIRQALQNKQLVLFSGTPCQVAGLKAYLGRDYPNLYLVDIFCHGVPSPLVFQQYLRENITDGEQFITTNFRNKQFGWKPDFTITTVTTASSISRKSSEDDFIRAFLQNLILRKSCSDCRFNRLPRQGDITIGDFWGVDTVMPDFHDEKGVSAVLLNTRRGKQLFMEVSNTIPCYRPATEKQVAPGNPVLYTSVMHHGNRDRFFSDLRDGKALHETLTDNQQFDYLCLNFCTANNYGAVLTAYALQCLLDTMGYSNAHIFRFHGDWVKEQYDGGIADKFIRQHLHVTRPSNTMNELEWLNTYAKRGFLVGSDQIFRDNYIQGQEDVYFLQFAHETKQRIAVAASFGKDTYNGKHAEKYFRTFDAITVRERDGVDILNQHGYTTGKHILDPVFLTDTQYFLKLIEGVDVPHDKIVGYVLDETPETSHIAETYGDDFLNIAKLRVSVEEYLAYIYHARFIITDSFHGTCFALLFHKPFICLGNATRGSSRFTSLFQTFGLQMDSLSTPPDWEKIDRIINEQRNEAIAYLHSVFAPEQSTEEVMRARRHLIDSRGQKELPRIPSPPHNAPPPTIVPSPEHESDGECSRRKIRLLGFLPLVTIRKRKDSMRLLLFGFLPLLKIYRKSSRKRYLLFDGIPLCTIIDK